MYKIIDLGHEVPETGESRVSLIDPRLVPSLVKTASKTASTEIQEFWDTIPQDDRYSWLWVIGVSAKEYYGCNNNGDAFTEEDLKNTHQLFVDNANVFLQHVNKDPAKGIGKPVFSWYNEAMHRVELILRIDKSKPDATGTVRKITNGEPLYVSMGCTVKYDVCSICGNKAPTRRDYCDHLRFNMKKILPDGRQVYALNPDPKFFDISIVAKPADPTAHTLDKRASLHGQQGSETPALSSAELGERSLDISQKLAALKKVSDIIKKVEGIVVDTKPGEPSDHAEAERQAVQEPHTDTLEDAPIRAVAHLAREGFQHMEYPVMPYEYLSSMGVSPTAFLLAMHHLRAPISLGDAAWLAGSRVMGHCPSHEEMGRMFSLLPDALSELCERPSLVDTLLHKVFAPCPEDAGSPIRRTLVIKVMRPVAEMRIRMLSRMAPEGALEKIGEAFGQPLEEQIHYGRTLAERIRKDFDPRAENFAPMTVRDKHGNVAVTAPYFVRNTATQEAASRMVDLPTVAGSALALGAVTAALGEPTLLGKVMAASLLGVASVGAFSLRENRDDEKVTTESCEEIPMTTMVESWKFKKTAASMPRFGTVAGLALPPALALDYMYNKWRYGDMADVKAEQPGMGGMALKAGRFVKEHPVLTTVGSGLLGSQLLRMPRFGRRIVPPVARQA
ncbi:MAG: hypothetical protein MSH27_05495 [Desulfovibrio piger]|uniref:hypothetical protein n=1 Tax=Desulfovibrio piger TaxID=901 RepID=UPI0026E9AB02|nr:hypothetical protein [Desulfovibrio piger]MCI7373571.1 hypothetical protein [Desulfovibrio piger]